MLILCWVVHSAGVYWMISWAVRWGPLVMWKSYTSNSCRLIIHCLSCIHPVQLVHQSVWYIPRGWVPFSSSFKRFKNYILEKLLALNLGRVFQGTLIKHLEEHVLQGNLTQDDVMLYYTTVRPSSQNPKVNKSLRRLTTLESFHVTLESFHMTLESFHVTLESFHMTLESFHVTLKSRESVEHNVTHRGAVVVRFLVCKDSFHSVNCLNDPVVMRVKSGSVQVTDYSHAVVFPRYWHGDPGFSDGVDDVELVRIGTRCRSSHCLLWWVSTRAQPQHHLGPRRSNRVRPTNAVIVHELLAASSLYTVVTCIGIVVPYSGKLYSLQKHIWRYLQDIWIRCDFT